jgi:hypothetical protein
VSNTKKNPSLCTRKVGTISFHSEATKNWTLTWGAKKKHERQKTEGRMMGLKACTL